MDRTFNGLSDREAFFELSELEFPIGFFCGDPRDPRVVHRAAVRVPKRGAASDIDTAADADVVAKLRNAARKRARSPATPPGRP